MLRIGSDTSKFPGAKENGPFWLLKRVASLGLEGAFFRTPFELSKNLDVGEIKDVTALARDLGLYVQCGVAKSNPFTTPAFPEIRQIGDGDYILGMTRIIKALAAAGITELWTATANYQFRFKNLLYACDRFRTDVNWDTQLRATAKVLKLLKPVLRDMGAHLNIETHEEITSFEVVRLVEEAGPEAFGITFDTANVLVRCEDPVAAAARVAPYTRATQVRDVALMFTPEGIGRFLVPVGQGILEWDQILRLLATHNPDLPISVEGVLTTRAEMPLFIWDKRWLAGHPDLTLQEFAEVIRLTREYEDRAAKGTTRSLRELRQTLSPEDDLAFIVESASALRSRLADMRRPTTS